MSNIINKKSIRGGGILLIFVGLYYIYQFKDFESNNTILGFAASTLIILLGGYSIFKKKKKETQ
jgi:LPXTG-motif cell wall-anchored protein